jgi:hypothetical protein
MKFLHHGYEKFASSPCSERVVVMKTELHNQQKSYFFILIFIFFVGRKRSKRTTGARISLSDLTG